MKYYRHPITGEVFAYESDGSQDSVIKYGLVQMTPSEIEEHLKPRQIVEQITVPVVVSAFQARAALLRSGLLDEVEELMNDPTTPREAVLAWEYATEFRRDSVTVAAIAQQLELTSNHLDELFMMAAAIEA